MLGKRKLVAACVLGPVAALTYTVFAVASSGPELTGPQTIRVKAIGGNATVLPLNPDKNSFFGNEFVINGPLYNWAGNTNVGRIHAECTFVDKQGVAADCTGTFFLRHGQIVARGLVDFGVDNHTNGSVLGGSGLYRNTRGQVTFANSTGDTEGFIFQLEP
jgi:hypothetical protein